MVRSSGGSPGVLAAKKEMKNGTARVHGDPLAWESKMVKQMGMKMSGDIIDSIGRLVIMEI